MVGRVGLDDGALAVRWAAIVPPRVTTPPPVRPNADLETGYAIRIRLIEVPALVDQRRVMANLDNSL